MAEWLNAPVLKTGNGYPSFVGSKPTLPATQHVRASSMDWTSWMLPLIALAISAKRAVSGPQQGFARISLALMSLGLAGLLWQVRTHRLHTSFLSLEALPLWSIAAGWLVMMAMFSVDSMWMLKKMRDARQ